MGSSPSHPTLDIESVSAIRDPERLSSPDLLEKLAVEINRMILEDFTGLVQRLYRMDVSESRLKECLRREPGTDAGKIIAALMVERQRQKLKDREHSSNPTSASQEEEW